MVSPLTYALEGEKMLYELEMARSHQTVEIDEKNVIKVMHANHLDTGVGGELVKESLEHPISSPRLKDIVRKGQKIVIITSDITRPMPSKVVLPYVLEELELADVHLSDVTVVLALGSHRSHTIEEKKMIVGEEVYEKVEVIDSDVNDYKHLGETENGTPVDIFTPVAEADIRICLGNIEFHYFAGYSGGAKAIMPGVSTRAAIQSNHKRMVDPLSHAGNLDTNPVRKDIDAVANYVSVDFIVNVVLNENKEIIKCVSGHYIDAHRAGCQFLDTLNKVELPKRADIVIVSAGGFPKDLNVYQSQKALDNSKHAVRDGGIIILVASAKEGYGEHTFEKWLKEAKKPSDLVDRIKKEFKLGGHKAAAIALVLERAKVYFVSELDDDFVRSLFFEPFKDVQSAYRAAKEELGKEDASVVIIPHGGSILPFIK